MITKPVAENGTSFSTPRGQEPPTSRPVERPKVYPDSWEGVIDPDGYKVEFCEPAPLWREW